MRDNIAKNPKYDGYERGLASMVYKFLVKSPQAAVLLIMIITMILNKAYN